MQPAIHPSILRILCSLAADLRTTQTYLPALYYTTPGRISWPRLTPTCSTEISFPALPLMAGRAGPYSVPAPELSISSSTPMQVGPISSRAPDARHAILTYASCCAATRHLRHATPSLPHIDTKHASSSTVPSILHTHTHTACWETGRAHQLTCATLSGPPCRGIINHTVTKKGKKRK